MPDYKAKTTMGTKGDVVSADKKTSWFYTDIVKDHFFNPRNFLDKDPEEGAFNAMGKVGSPACGDELRVWMRVGEDERIKDFKWKTFGSLIIGEEVLLPDFSSKSANFLRPGSLVLDGEGKQNTVKSVFTTSYTGPIVSLRLSTSAFYSFSLTPIHPIPCIPQGSVCYPDRKSGHWSEVRQEKVDTAEIVVKPASSLREGDFLIYQVDQIVENQQNLSDQFCTLLGYYVSDGCRVSSNRIRFDFGVMETEYVDEVVHIAKMMKIPCRVFDRKDARIRSVFLQDRDTVALLVQHGGGPGKKRFSSVVMKLSHTKQMMIVDAYVNGDGWTQQQKESWNVQYFISSSKEQLVFQLQMMLARNRIFAPIHKRPARSFAIRGKKYRNEGEYNLIFRKQKNYSRIKYSNTLGCFLIPIQSITCHSYRGKIVDLGLSDPPHIYRVKGISIHNCGSAIASTSMTSVMVTEHGGMTLEAARKIRPQDIMARLGGLPARKFHCSVLCDKALRDAINDYYRRTNRIDKIVVEAARVIDPASRVTDHDIEEAVLDGACTIEDVQRKTKVGIGNPGILPAVEELIRFYREKYFGSD